MLAGSASGKAPMRTAMVKRSARDAFRKEAFANAQKHSRRVRALKIVVPAAAILIAGAFVAAAEVVIQWLVQRARTYIFTTGASPVMASALLASIDLIELGDARRSQLRHLAAQLQAGLADTRWRLTASPTAIQPLLIGDNFEALRIADALFEDGLWVPAIRPPTVPKGSARLRVSLSAAHSQAQVAKLIDALRKLA